MMLLKGSIHVTTIFLALVSSFVSTTTATSPSTAAAAAPAPGLGLALHRWYIHIFNNMSQGEVLTTHCKSKDDDLGIRKIFPRNEWNWTFKENFFQTTLFWCYLAKDKVHHAAFEVFSENEELQNSCDYKHCRWEAREDGFYLFNIPKNQAELRYKWQP
ncbi:Plant self-incompatibility S1 [Corchorus olitorius]|uniref:S-protein homolog n=1 Tax=Corchorus olitorius TaxID=93759 RepID=A0A1R3G5V7_9ROSI|nr:Plant self-incompatibility S1 [Corchorus olitorius]